MPDIVQHIISQRTIGYNYTPDYTESVVESLCAMASGAQEYRYDGYRQYHNGDLESVYDYGKRRPYVQKAQADI